MEEELKKKRDIKSARNCTVPRRRFRI